MSEQQQQKRKLNLNSKNFQSQPMVQPIPYPQYQQQYQAPQFMQMNYYYPVAYYQQQPQMQMAQPNQFTPPQLQSFVSQQQFQQDLMKQKEDQVKQKTKEKKKVQLKLNSKQFTPGTTINKEQQQQQNEIKEEKKEEQQKNEQKEEQQKNEQKEEQQKKEQQKNEQKEEQQKNEQKEREQQKNEQKEESKTEDLIKTDEEKDKKIQKSEQNKEVKSSAKDQINENQENQIEKKKEKVEEPKNEQQESTSNVNESPSQSNISQLLKSKKTKRTEEQIQQQKQEQQTKAVVNSNSEKKEIGQVKVIISTQVFVKLIQEAKSKKITNVKINEILNRECQEIKSRIHISSPNYKKQGKHYQQKAPAVDHSSSPSIQREQVSEEQIKMKSQVNQFMKAKREEEKKDTSKKDKKDLKFELNKLCPTNFDNIKHSIEALMKQNWKYCVYLAKIIIEKAWTEQKYAQTYAKLCFYLMKKMVMSEPPSDEDIDQEMKLNQGIPQQAEKKEEKKKEEEAKTPEEEGNQKNQQKARQHIFKYILLKNIQSMFEDQKDINDRKQNDESQKKQRILGNVHFIGELFQENVISYKVIFICVTELLKKFYIDYLKYHERILNKVEVKAENSYELDLEGIFTFFGQFGEKVSEAEKKKKQEKGVEYFSLQTLQALLGSIHEAKAAATFEALEKEIHEKFGKKTADISLLFELLSFFQDKARIQQRIKCLIKNLIAQRESAWKKVFHKEGPLKVSELHQEFELEKQAREQKAQKYYEQDNKHYNKQESLYQPKQLPGFQSFPLFFYSKKKVAGERTEQKFEDNAQEDDSTENIPTSSLSFSRNFGDYKGSQIQLYQEKKQQPQEPKEQQLTYTDLEVQMVEFLRHWEQQKVIKEEGEVKYDANNFYNDCEELCKKSQCFISCYLSKFTECRSNQLEERQKILEKLMSNKKLTPARFVPEFNITLKKAWLASDELPLIYFGLANCFITLADSYPTEIQFKDINTDIVDDAQDEEFIEMAFDFLEKLFKNMYELIKKKGLWGKFSSQFTELIQKVDKENNYNWFK